MNPKISVVIPTRHRPVLLQRAVHSAIRQTWLDLEVIVVIDGPDPDTVAALQEFDDPRLRVLALAEGVGGSEARNLGVRAALGGWIALLDDDDEWLPEKIEKQLAVAEQFNGPRVLVTCRYLDRMDGAELVRPRKFLRPGQHISDFLYGEISLLGAMEGFPQTSTWFVSRELLLEVPFRKGLKQNQDTDWVLQALGLPNVHAALVEETLSIFHNEHGRARITSNGDWKGCRDWAIVNRQLFTGRALSSYLAIVPMNFAARKSFSWKTARSLLRDCRTYGAIGPKVLWHLWLFGFLYPRMRPVMGSAFRKKVLYFGSMLGARRGSARISPGEGNQTLQPDARRILVYRTDMLPLSETFILTQTRALKSFRPRLIGMCRPEDSLDVPSDTLLLTGDRTRWTVVRKRLYWMTGLAPWFHRNAAHTKAALVHAHFGPDGITAAHIAKVLRLPLIVTLHGYDVTIPRKSPDTYAKLWRQASLFLCVSEFIRGKAIAAGFPAEKLRVHHIGIDCSRFSPTLSAPKPDTILFVGRLIEKKGCEYLLRAMAHVQGARPGAELTIIGDGVLRTPLEELAKQLDLNCRFLGSQPSEVVRQALETARVFCAPSVTASNGDSEGLAMVFAEALAMGVPVVTSDHGGIRELVEDGVTGILAPERDSEKLAEGILRYLSDDELWTASRARGVAKVRNEFNLATQTERLEQIYSEVISRSGAAAASV